jgi:hypothetical protein
MSTQWFSLYSRGKLPSDGMPWSPLPQKVTRILRRVSAAFPSLSEAGFEVKKGPATGATAFFVRPRREFPISEYAKRKHLLPLFSSNSLRTLSAFVPEKYLLSVYEPDTQRLYPLDEFPEDLQNYFLENRRELAMRHMVKKRKREWWSTIDHFDPSLRECKKVLIPDMRGGDGVMLDRGNVFPDHTVLYALGPSRKLESLAYALSSPMSDLFRLWQSPILRNGTPRASSRVVSRLPYVYARPDKDRNVKSPEYWRNLYDALGLEKGEALAIETAHASIRGH